MTKPLAPGEGKRGNGNVIRAVAEELTSMDQADVNAFARIAMLAARGNADDIINLCEAGMQRNMASAFAEKAIAKGDIADADAELAAFRLRRQQEAADL